MPRVRLSVGRARPAASWVRPRARALNQALVAAGAPALLPTYDMVYGSQAGRVYETAVIESGFSRLDATEWPSDATSLADVAASDEIFRQGTAAVYRLGDGTLVLFELRYGFARVRAASPNEEGVFAAAALFQALYPATYLSATEDRVPVTFWALGPHGPIQRLRMIAASPWETIERNYTASVRDELGGLMTAFVPGSGGQLLLWQGPPGTGKTWALRALVSQWAQWAEFHCITDPDAFFVESAAYMIEVLLAESYSAIERDTGDVYEEEGPDGKWRVLILEDTGELLSANAKEKYGQGLSRLLNVVDGMIGQGLRVLVLVTTNDELGDLNPAVLRPGRCASQIEFAPMTPAEVSEWLGADADESASLAELYARSGDGADALPDDPEPDEPPDLAASGGDVIVVPGTNVGIPRKAFEAAVAMARAASVEDVLAEIRSVAEANAPDGGYGDTWWSAEKKAVFWNAADWSTDDEVAAAERAFLAIDGVDGFESDAEIDSPGDGWEQVWPEPGSDAALERVLALASRPLDLDEKTRAPRRADSLISSVIAEAPGEGLEILRIRWPG